MYLFWFLYDLLTSLALDAASTSCYALECASELHAQLADTVCERT